MSKIKKLSTALFILSILCVPSPMSAQSEQTEICGGTELVQASAYVPVSPETTYIFAKAARAEDAVAARLYFQSSGEMQFGACEYVGETKLSTDMWQSVGRINVDAESVGSLILTLDSTDDSQAGASAPQIIMTSAVPSCDLQNGCQVTYQDDTFTLYPRKISMNADTLRVGQLLPIESDDVREVIYSVDGHQAYRSDRLEPFNMRYVSGGEHTLERTAVLASGQSLSHKEVIENGQFGDLGYYVLSFYSRYSKIIIYVGVLLGVFIVWSLVVACARWLYKRRQWRLNHVAGQRTYVSRLTGAVDEDKLQGSIVEGMLEHRKKIIGIIVVFTVLFVGYGSVFSYFTVDGVSMYPTFEDRSKQPLFTLPATVGRVSGAGYVPARGTVVVVKEAQSNLFDTGLTEQSAYVVKRIIGLPGDRVVIVNGVITIFNEEHKDGFVPDNEYGWVKDLTGSEYFKTDITLKENELFVVGDNRDESIDSRFYGPVQSSQIIGKVL